MNIRALSAAIWLVAIVVVAYASSFQGLFFFDDEHIFRDGIRSWPTMTEFFRPGRSLVNLTFTANLKVNGFDPWGYHLVNLAVHLATALTIWSVAKWGADQVFGQGKCHSEQVYVSDSTLFGWTVAVLWAVHPLTTESVTYVVQRYEAMAVLFMLLTLRCWCGIMEGRPGYLLGVFLFSWCAVLSKEITLALPFVLIAWEFFFRKHVNQSQGDPPANLRLVKSIGAFFVFTSWISQVMVVGGYLASQTAVATTSDILPRVTVDRVSPWDYLKTQSCVIFHYLKLVVFPIDLRLDYGWPIERDPWRFVPCMFALTLTAVVGGFLWTKRAVLGLLIIMCFIALAPRSSFVPSPDMVFEHRMHFPLVFVVAILQVGLFWLAFRTSLPRKFFVGASLLLVLLFGARTHLRNQDYQSELTFWRKNYELSPENPRVNHTLGIVLANQGKWEKAKSLFQTAVEINPGSAKYWLALGDAERELGNVNEAIEIFTKIVECGQLEGPALQRRGYLREVKGDLVGAEQDYRRAVRLEDAEATYNLALLLFKRKGFEEALVLCRSLQGNEQLAAAVSKLTASIRNAEREAAKTSRESSTETQR
ncbi:MAG: tetratricopeptide repeat protein [Rhodopirellula sp. JB055]|uniref:tetratricopeptide repeat protein n=1 Tax=Rhodopirellula sp. JB055 TaxID=3342846 RepID=UPI00370A2BDD